MQPSPTWARSAAAKPQFTRAISSIRRQRMTMSPPLPPYSPAAMRGRGMPEVATVEGIGAHAGRTVTLRGWLAGRRSSGKLHFLQVRDGTGTIQCVMAKAEVPAEVFALADHLPQESSL